jgi:hypothetical protein
MVSAQAACARARKVECWGAKDGPVAWLARMARVEAEEKE